MKEVSGQSNYRDDRQFDMLLADYAAVRDDDRGVASVIVTAFSIAVTLIGVMAAAVTQTCEFSNAKSCTHVPDYILAASPLIPIALLAYVTMQGINATLRNFYLRGLEEKLQEYVSEPILGELRAFSYTGMTTQSISLRRGRVSFRILANLLFVAIILIFGGYSAYVGFHVDEADQIAMAVAYGSAAGTLVWAVIQGTIRGRTLFTETAENFLGEQEVNHLPQPMRKQKDEDKDERSLVSYLIFPRPEDWIKWVITPGVFVVTAWSTGGFSRWSTFLALWLILEYLIYNARYQWNDVRGVIEDDSEGNRRLPVGPGQKHMRHNVTVSVNVGVLRLVLALALAIVLKLTVPILLLVVLVFTIAIVYEALRSYKPVSIAQEPDILQRLQPRAIAIWCIVGLGYGIRAGVGFIVGGISATSWKFVDGVLLFIAFGIMFVAMTWVLAATDYCLVGPGDRWRWKPDAYVKPHIALLLRYVPKIRQYLTVSSSQSTQGPNQIDGCTSGRLDHILIKYNSFRTPWNLAFAASIILGSLLGSELAPAKARLVLDIIVLFVSLLGAFLMITSTSRKARTPGGKPPKDDRAAKLPLVICASGALLIVCVAILFSPFPKALIAVVPWLAVTGVYLTFCYSSYEDIKIFARQMQTALHSLKRIKLLPKLLIRFIIGEKTWDGIISLSKSAELTNVTARTLRSGNGTTPNGKAQHTGSASKPVQYTERVRQPKTNGKTARRGARTRQNGQSGAQTE